MRRLFNVDAEIYASHHQVYVADLAAAGDDPDLWAFFDDAPLWDGRSLEQRISTVRGGIAFGTVAYEVVPVTVEVWDGEPPGDLGAWDHVTEASIDVDSGRIVLGSVEGRETGVEPVAVTPGTYRARVSATGLEEADEMTAGDSYRVQLWQAPTQESRVVKWWAAWDPAGVRPRPTTSGGRLRVGAEAEDARTLMAWLASRGSEHLFEDADGVLWEHSNLPDRSGTPQLEELPPDEAERRYGPRDSWTR